MHSLYTSLKLPNTGILAGTNNAWGLFGVRLGQSLEEARSALTSLGLHFDETKVAAAANTWDFLSTDDSLPEELNTVAQMRLSFDDAGQISGILALVLGNDGLGAALGPQSTPAEAVAALRECAQISCSQIDPSSRLTFDGIDAGVLAQTTSSGLLAWDQNRDDSGFTAFHQCFVVEGASLSIPGGGKVASFTRPVDYEKALGSARQMATQAGKRQALIAIGMASSGQFTRPAIMVTAS